MKKVARTHSDLTSGRMMALSALNRAKAAIIKTSFDPSKDLSGFHIFSKNQENVSYEVKTESLGGPDGLMNTVEDGLTYYTLEDGYGVDTSPTWQRLPVDHGPDTPDGYGVGPNSTWQRLSVDHGSDTPDEYGVYFVLCQPHRLGGNDPPA